MSDTHRCTGQPCQLPVLPRKRKTVSCVQRARASERCVLRIDPPLRFGPVSAISPVP